MEHFENWKDLLNPEFYPVDLSTACWENRNTILKKVTKKSN